MLSFEILSCMHLLRPGNDRVKAVLPSVQRNAHRNHPGDPERFRPQGFRGRRGRGRR